MAAGPGMDSGADKMNQLAATTEPVVHTVGMGCTVHRNRHGKLTFRLYYEGQEFWEGIGLDASEENLKLARAQAVIISSEIRRKTFDYLKWFPGGNKAYLFKQASAQITIRQQYEKWILDQRPPLVRKTLEKSYRHHLTAYVLPYFGDALMGDIGTDHLEAFRTYLLHDRGLALKTTRNIIGASFRAFWRHSLRVAKVVQHNPFLDLEWPDAEELEPDPFIEAERDAIIEYFRTRNQAYYPWVYFLFWTGMRPSEACSLRLGNVDLKLGKVSITHSRVANEENRTKTRKSRRVITLLPNVIEVLNRVGRLRGKESDFLFTNNAGRPIEQSAFRQWHWYTALTGAGIGRPRKPYCTRHTFISVMLSHGEKEKRIADYCGTSVLMIEKHYGKYIRDDSTFGLRALEAAEPPPTSRKNA